MWVKFMHYLHSILFQMNAKCQSSRNKFSAPDLHFVYKLFILKGHRSKVQMSVTLKSDMDLRIGRGLEAGRRSDSYIYVIVHL